MILNEKHLTYPHSDVVIHIRSPLIHIFMLSEARRACDYNDIIRPIGGLEISEESEKRAAYGEILPIIRRALPFIRERSCDSGC
jgi:hypothetical protein